MPKNEQQSDRMLIIQAPDQKKPIKIEAWKYYEIIDLLRERGVDRQQAYDAAKWAGRARDFGEKYTQIPHYILSLS